MDTAIFFNRMKRLAAIIIFLLLTDSLLPCGSEIMRFQHISVAQGLSQNTVFAILQDFRGFLWFGTEDGLNRYDGYNMVVYKHDPDTPYSLNHNLVRAIMEDHEQTIWAGTKQGLNRYSREMDNFVPFTLLSHHDISAICEDRDGELWIATREDGLIRLDKERNKIKYYKHNPTGSENPSDTFGPCSNSLRVLREDKTGNLWIGSEEGGLSKYNKEKDAFYHYTYDPAKADSLGDDSIRALYEDNTGTLWIGTVKGLSRFVREKDNFINYEPGNKTDEKPGRPNSPYVRSIFQDNTGVLWFGTYRGGLNRCDQEKETFTNFRHTPGVAGSLSNDCVLSLLQDSGGVLWVGTENGINKYDLKKKKFTLWNRQTIDHDSTLDNQVWAIYKDKHGQLFIGTDGGLIQLNRETGNYTLWKANTDGKVSKENGGCLSDDRVYAICEDHEGYLWIGTGNGGLNRFDPREKRFTCYRHNPAHSGDPCNLSHDEVFAICEEPPGFIWVGTRNGLNRLDKRTGQIEHWYSDPDNPKSLSHDRVTSIIRDSGGTIWIGTKGGLNQWMPGTGTFERWTRISNESSSLSSNDILYLREDSSGTLWVGTDWGLNKFNREKGTFTRYTSKNGLPNDKIYGILEDETGDLWLSTNSGISRFNPGNNTFRHYDAHDGLQGNEFNGSACFKSSDGEMFFGGSNGLNSFYLSDIKDNPHVPPIVITDFQIFNESAVIGGSNSPLKKAISETKDLVLSYKHYVFSFDFAALDFTAPSKNKYECKMEGFETDWVHRNSSKRFVTYTNLKPGKYVFRVKGSNNDGVWNEQGVSVRIVIIPPFWQTWLFRHVIFLVFAILSYLIINFVKNYITIHGFWKREKYIGKYKLEEKLATGGMGTVYRAHHTQRKTAPVAVKVLREELFTDEVYRKRFEREAAIVDQMDHPHIVKILARGQYKQKLFIIMELLEGETLAKRIAEEPLIPLDQVFYIMLQIADALTTIHSKNIVHRDLKPENVMLVEKDGKPNYVKLLDFGLAKAVHQTRITQTGTVLGTLNYMAPEQISLGEFSTASDIYSLGVVLYEAVTGHVPFPGEELTHIMKQIMNRVPSPPLRLRSDLPPGLNTLIMNMMKKESSERPSLEDVIEALNQLRHGT